MISSRSRYVREYRRYHRTHDHVFEMPPAEQCWPSSGHDTPYQISSSRICNRSVKNTLRGFFTVAFPSGLIIRDCMLHEKNGKRWVSLPAREYTD
jgi:hypothetical protein